MPEQLSPENLDSVHDEALHIDKDAEQLRLREEHAEKGFQELSLLASDERDFNFSIFSDEPEFVENLKKTYERQFLPNSDLTIFIDPVVQEIHGDKVNNILEYLKSQEFEKDVELVNNFLPDSYAKVSEIPPIFIHSAETLEKIDFHKKNGFVKLPPISSQEEVGIGPKNINVVLHKNDAKSNRKSTIIHELVHNSEPWDWRYTGLFNEGVAKNVEQRVTGKDSDEPIIWSKLKEPTGHPLVKGLPHDQSGFNFKLLEMFSSEAQGLNREAQSKEEEKVFDTTRYDFVACFLDWCRFQPKNPQYQQSRQLRPSQKDQKLSFLSPPSPKTEKSLLTLAYKDYKEKRRELVANGDFRGFRELSEQYEMNIRLIQSPFLNLVFGKQEVRDLGQEARKLREAKTEEEISERSTFYYNFIGRFYDGIRKIEKDFNSNLNTTVEYRRRKSIPW